MLKFFFLIIKVYIPFTSTTAYRGRPYIFYEKLLFFVVTSVYLLNYLLDLNENCLIGS